MNKEIIIKLLTNTNVDVKDLNTFVTEYTYEKLNRDITSQELSGIIQAIQMRIFNLRFALLRAAETLHLNVLDVFDKNNKLIRTDIYESF